ncbi:TPA: hypothetical protein RQP16_004042 [Klebsiella michiganensis]|uniref:hypothetical protein n=1 Tax=Klebsiella TaxID=570 RepID=UPI0013A58625|nr:MULTISPECIES: hypothetical protein [Klebsiella]QLX13013.1 hypothetical protein HV230_04995 [Klebsiella oxytoca]EKQ6537685.1 hypothetical protein [Klebsiella michiganensis]ELQ7989989.1 hypothetical protein [Klebsiella michiganensis]MBG2582368.1 hypothetical protein [Klebsiella michiganensis]MBG2595284.1 hypothetical protein [Klebsiella michiganensis]
MRSSSRLALRLAGLRVHSRLRVGSPGKARSAASGEGAQHEVLLRSSSRLALRLAGLRIHSRLRVGSPGKARSAATRGMCRDECIGAVFSPARAALSRTTGS